MLVVVENGNVAPPLQLPLNLKATGRGNVLQIDAAEGAGDQIYRVDKRVHVLCFDAQGEGVHIAESLEQGAFALHDGHARLGTDVAQTQYRTAIGNDRAQVVAAGQFVGFANVLLDLKTGLGYAGGVGQGQLVLAAHRHGGDDFNLSLPLAVELEGFFGIIHNGVLLKLCIVPGNGSVAAINVRERSVSLLTVEESLHLLLHNELHFPFLKSP